MTPLPRYTDEDLLRAGRALTPPFVVAHDFNDGRGVQRFVIEQLLRLLPERRLAARARPLPAMGDTPAADAQPLLLKLFYGAGAARYGQRERAGYERLAAARLLTPELLQHSDTVLCYRWLDHAAPVAEHDADAIDAVVDSIGQLHEAGLLQSDMHLGNFLYRDERVWLVDADGIRAAGGDNRVAPAYRDNLAVFFAQLPPMADRQLPGRLMRYCHSARIATDSLDASILAAQLPDAVDRARADRVDRYLSKTLRDCTAFYARQGHRRRFVCQRDALGPELARFAEAPERVLDDSVVLKAGNTATVMRVPIDGVSRIVKRYNIKSPIHRLRQTLRSSTRAERSWRSGHRLQFLRVPTAAPIALLETRHGALRDVAYLVTEDLGSEDLLQHLAEQPLTDALFAQITDLFQALVDCRLVHGDMKATNLLVRDERLYLIDLDSMVVARQSGRRGARKDRARFLANWPASSAIGARLRTQLRAD